MFNCPRIFVVSLQALPALAVYGASALFSRIYTGCKISHQGLGLADSFACLICAKNSVIDCGSIMPFIFNHLALCLEVLMIFPPVYTGCNYCRKFLSCAAWLVSLGLQL
jgi:hypothetical protein